MLCIAENPERAVRKRGNNGISAACKGTSRGSQSQHERSRFNARIVEKSTSASSAVRTRPRNRTVSKLDREN